jgi:YesN/AraC family two-component response regulator
LSTSPTLPDLAKKLHTTTNNVSQVINERLQLSFPDLIAKYRIEEAQRLMRDPSCNDTVEGIAYSVGYHSKSTFHTAFKRFTGQTPAEYKASLKP